MLTANVIHRVLKVRTGDVTGTAFTIEHHNKQYLVTAGHLVEHLRTLNAIDIYVQDRWISVPVEMTGISRESDIAVFSAKRPLTPTFDLEPTSKGLTYGQDVYFVGFPHDIMGYIGNKNRGLPLPLVKRACMSAFAKSDTGVEIFLLDGHNNPGFSGAPVVFHPMNSNDPTTLKVCGVISGYISKPLSTRVANSDAELVLWQNTGVIVCNNIKHAVDQIEGNPNGAAFR